MIEAVPARTALANGHRYVSCMVCVISSVISTTTFDVEMPRAYLVVHIRADCLDSRSIGIGSGAPLDLLLVGDIVLRGSLDPSALDTLNSHCYKFSREINIRTEAFPIAATERRSTKRPYHWA
jgi:hypothetical protein